MKSALSPLRLLFRLGLLVAAWLICASAWAAEATEEGGGTLTGPFISLALLGSLLLAFAAGLDLKWRRMSAATATVALALVAPWLSWELSPGIYCRVRACSMETEGYVYPLFEPRLATLAAMGILASCVVLRLVEARR